MRQGRPDSEHVSLLTPQLKPRPHPRPRRCAWFLHQSATSSLAAGARVPSFSIETSGIPRVGGAEVGLLLLPARSLFSLLLDTTVSGARGSPPWCPGERALDWEGSVTRTRATGLGLLGRNCGRPLPRLATAARATLLPRGRQRGPGDAQKAPDVEQPLCPSALTSCAWHRARHLRAQR